MSSSFYSPFPDDKIRFDFPFHLKADRFYETGTPPVARRGLVLEFLEGSAESNWGSVVDSLAAAGYRPIGSPKTESNGRKIQGFTKDGQPRLTVAISDDRSEEHTSELQSLMRISYAVFCLKKKKQYSTLSSKTLKNARQ